MPSDLSFCWVQGMIGEPAKEAVGQLELSVHPPNKHVGVGMASKVSEPRQLG